MINHISIGVTNPENVANVLAELWGGYAMPFPPSAGGYVVFAEVIPADVQLVPGMGLPDDANFNRDSITDHFEATFVPGNEGSLFGSVHLNINSPLDEESIKAIGKREGWRCFTANRGRGLFQLIELWIEDRFMLEVNTPEMTEIYVNTPTANSFMNLEKVYTETSYVVDDGPVKFTIRLGGSNHNLQSFLREREAETWAFVTAHNPRSRRLPDDENSGRQSELIKMLVERQYGFLAGEGVGDDPEWEPEPSLFILDIDRVAAIALGSRFDQNAVLWGKLDHEPELIWCD